MEWPADGLRAAPSLIPGAGLGLFVSQAFEPESPVCTYYGNVLTLTEAIQQEQRDYIMGGFGFNTYVDAALDCPGRYVNSHFETGVINTRFECYLEPRPYAQLIAERRIEAGEELYVEYGDDYWLTRGIDPKTGRRLNPADLPSDTREALELMEEVRRGLMEQRAARDPQGPQPL
jgi:hypothetical protein